MIHAPLTGIVPPMVTPMRGRNELDVPGLERVIEHVLAGRVSGLFVLGTTSEGPSLGYRLRRELIQRVCRRVAQRGFARAASASMSCVVRMKIRIPAPVRRSRPFFPRRENPLASADRSLHRPQLVQEVLNRHSGASANLEVRATPVGGQPKRAAW